jgi:hypothetical protein
MKNTSKTQSNRIIIFVLFFFSTEILFACSCWGYEPNFYKNISAQTINCIAVFDKEEYLKTEFEPGERIGHFVLTDTIGDFGLKIGDTIRVIGQNGLNCGESLSRFSRGDTLVLALSAYYPYSSIKDTFYLEGACGKYFLPIKYRKCAGLSIPEIKQKMHQVIRESDKSCKCTMFLFYQDFYHVVSDKTQNCMAVFQGFDYSYEFGGLRSQTGRFVVLDKTGSFTSAPGDTIVVLGEDGLNCGEMLDQFRYGDTLFLALKSSPYQHFEKDTFYLESSTCGVHFLKVTNGKCGNLTIPEVKQKIDSIISGVDGVQKDKGLTVIFNPVTQRILIKSFKLITDVMVFDISGRQVQHTAFSPGYDVETALKVLSRGVYHVLIHGDEGSVVRKIII